jgi:flagellar biosynthesis/type III secretory pathway ATPase
VADPSVRAIISSKFRDVMSFIDIIIQEHQDSRGAVVVAVADEDLLCSTCCCELGLSEGRRAAGSTPHQREHIKAINIIV